MKCWTVATLLLAVSSPAVAQNWHAAGDTLKLPESPGHVYSSIGSLKSYDTVPCTYTVSGSTALRKGFKKVYIRHGFYTDNARTLYVFFDDGLRRVRHVDRFYFH
ncbi:hypothetical protein Q4E93_21030 [Flavitalea sp. BT771]|uniref:hypothetical protein n=1 Tax=Flavitalea sp. BT771 TaxID=3063329 RepID=UPI0026E1EFEA|nr:hypothetical protein [Flavitalea sp. BT771]MDO6433106.1 hypothetical protein [Flavitalea sp. BT771]MDV6221618.1 hypothetical protein [Flavitalea sp. BT771]